MQERAIQQNAVMLRMSAIPLQDNDATFARHLTNFGFSEVVTGDRDGTVTGLSACLQTVADGDHLSALDFWTALEQRQEHEQTAELDLAQSNLEALGAVALLAQMSLPAVPIVGFGRAPQDLPRDQAHFVRSLVFWRNRNGIARMSPRMVHAGDDGTLVFILGSWMIALNWNDDEISIDIGDTGTMWLMLGTPRDVQLQGSLLILPAYSGAILANELAR